MDGGGEELGAGGFGVGEFACQAVALGQKIGWHAKARRRGEDRSQVWSLRGFATSRELSFSKRWTAAERSWVLEDSDWVSLHAKPAHWGRSSVVTRRREEDKSQVWSLWGFAPSRPLSSFQSAAPFETRDNPSLINSAPKLMR